MQKWSVNILYKERFFVWNCMFNCNISPKWSGNMVEVPKNAYHTVSEQIDKTKLLGIYSAFRKKISFMTLWPCHSLILFFANNVFIPFNHLFYAELTYNCLWPIQRVINVYTDKSQGIYFRVWTPFQRRIFKNIFQQWQYQFSLLLWQMSTNWGLLSQHKTLDITER